MRGNVADRRSPVYKRRVGQFSGAFSGNCVSFICLANDAFAKQNAQAYVSKDALKAEVAATIRAIFTARDLSASQTLLKAAVVRYQASGAAWLEHGLSEGLTVFALPKPYRRFLRTSNGLKRVNKELRRRFRVIDSFVSEVSCLRLEPAVLMEIRDKWERFT